VSGHVAGRVAVITGAGRGLGAGLALHFAGSGMHLGLCARHRPALVVRTRPTAAAGRVVAAETPLRAAVDVTDSTFGPNPSDQVVCRVPDQPVSGLAG
jgi:NAD(P)-dependent dehydrogenase (short-subunit alcohol dehydrogenase family)